MSFAEEKIKEIIEGGTSTTLYEKKPIFVLTPDPTGSCLLPATVEAVPE